MISLRKFLSLSPSTRLRKTVRLIHRWEGLLSDAGPPPEEDIRVMTGYLAAIPPEELPSGAEDCRGRLLRLLSRPEDADREDIRWELNSLRHLLSPALGMETADWDLHPPADGAAVPRKILPCRVYADCIRSPFNLGSLFRTAECFGVEEILLAPGGASPEHRRTRRSAMGSVDMVPHRYAEPEELEGFEGVFALETGGTPLEDFVFPVRGVCIVGSEELGVRGGLRGLAAGRAGIVSLPLRGAKGSLNVSVAFGILMHAWSRALTRGS